MTNKEIARLFNQLAGLMELHGSSPYKTKSYQNAYLQLRKTATPLVDMSDTEILALKGIGKSLAAKIREILNTGTFQALGGLKNKTPKGIQEMLNIKGFGAKKIRVIWNELNVENLGELLYACNENRLVKLKGFGQKTQADLKQKIEYYLQSKDKFHYATLEREASELQSYLQELLPNAKVAFTGALRRRCIILDNIEVIIGIDDINNVEWLDNSPLEILQHQNNIYQVKTANNYPATLYVVDKAAFGSKQFRYTGSKNFLTEFVNNNKGIDFSGLATEKEIFEQSNTAFIEPELREAFSENNITHSLIQLSDIKGVIHAHSTYSDGINTLREMAEYSKQLGFEYLVITDHSQSAFYANGLQPERVLEQMKEIDELNQQLAPFKIFKGIESDILSNGDLDYSPELLKQFDIIIASVHSNLKMTSEKATERIIKAIQNPFTTILGHPTGRLLLSREGYPIDYQKIIDVCAEHNVAIELNANPYRLDLDWKWIPYATQKGVKIAINPDAHSTQGIHDTQYGLYAARKGGLIAQNCFNNMDLAELESFIINRSKAMD